MAFSFGAASTPAPAPAGGGFSFGGGAPAAAAAAPSTSGGLFGNTATTTTGGGLFGTPAPAPATTGGSLFGGTPAASAPAPTGGGLFGSTTTPAPAPTAGGLFGAPAPAATGSLFGAPAPASGGLFGSAPAPASGSLFGAPQPAPAMQQQQQYQQPLSGNTPYSQLPDNAKRAIDGIYQLMMQHRRTLASVKTMAPALLTVENDGGQSTNKMNSATISSRGGLSPADAAAGSPRRSSSNNNKNKDPSSLPLPQQMIALHSQIQTLLQSAESNLIDAQQLKVRAGEATVQAKMHGAWPMENVAARRGVALSTVRGILGNSGNANATSQSFSSGPSSSSTTPTTAATGVTGGTPASSLNVSGMDNIDAIALQHIMDIRAAHVDRIEAMPSPYLWDVLRNFEQRVAIVQRDVDAVRDRLAIAEEAERVQSMGGFGRGSGVNETALLLTNADNFNAMTSLMLYEGSEGAQAPLSKRLATLARSQNDMFLHIAEKAARAHERLAEVKSRYRRFCESTKGGYYDDPFIKADIEEVSREREMQQKIMEEQIATAPPPPVAAAAPTAQGPAPSTSLFGASPAPAGGGLFGAPAPAPSGGLFGAPAPAPSGGGLFGSTPAPAPAGGGLFGAPAPAPSGGGLFGSTPAPAAGGLFGSTPAPAPAAGGGLFGAPATAAGGLFSAVPTTPATTLAPKKKPGSRNRRR